MFIKQSVIIISFFIISSFTSVYSQNFWSDLFTPSLGGTGDVQLGGGISSLHQLNLPKPLIGMHLKLRHEDDGEIFGKDRKAFFYIGAGYFIKQDKQREGAFNAVPKDTSLFDPITVPYKFNESVSYLMFELGEDYYLFTNEKELFSIYGGYIAGLNIPFYRFNYQLAGYDQSNYILQTETGWKNKSKESKPNYKLGLNIGIDMPVGAFGSVYFETSPFFNLLSEKYLSPDFTIKSRFFLGLNMGYRYEF